jgi:hypothetical protein
LLFEAENYGIVLLTSFEKLLSTPLLFTTVTAK